MLYQERLRLCQGLALPILHYYLTNRDVCKCFLFCLEEEVCGEVKRQWNSDRHLLLLIVVFQNNWDVKGSERVCRHIDQWIYDWNKGNYDPLTHDLVHTFLSHITYMRGAVNEEQREATYIHLAIEGKLCQAVRYLM